MVESDLSKIVVVEGHKCLGASWLVKVARKKSLGSGVYEYDENKGSFYPIIDEDFLKEIKATVFDKDLVIPNFNQAKHYKLGTEIYLKNEELPCSVIAIKYFDGLTNQKRVIGFDSVLSCRLESRETTNLSPEQRYFIYKTTAKEKEDELRKQLERELSQEEKIRYALRATGGELITYYEKDNDFIVCWSCDGTSIVSVVDKDLKIKELGFCANGFDYTQSLSSAVLLFKVYNDNDDIFITRRMS